MTLQRTTTSGDGESGGARNGLGGPAPATRHDHLLMRQAAEALQAAGEPLSAAALAGQLGVRPGRPPVAPRTSPPAHLVQRLEAALAQDSAFVRDAAGLWGLASWRSADDTSSPLLAEYAVLDATLPSGMRDGAIRLAGVRLRAGQIVDPYFVRFRPAPPREPEAAGGVATPRLQAPATGVGAAGQRPASAVLPEVRGWLGAAVVVGQDVRPALGALNEQAERCEQAPFDNRLLELADLAQLLLPGARRPSLMRLADALGVAPRLRHPSLGDARLIAELLLAVLRRLDGRGGGGDGEALFGWISGGPAGAAAGAGGGAAPGAEGENPGGIWPAGPTGAENRPGELPVAPPPPGAA
ncbi:MAG TPA: exonuclease domain-containing protein, partial [Chloroflexota bacterium]|nr:exonuclease domain-containing protein [Chloroflexota bacterium]